MLTFAVLTSQPRHSTAAVTLGVPQLLSGSHGMLGRKGMQRGAAAMCSHMPQAMGLKPKSRPAAKPKLDEAEMADLMRKARGEGEEEPTMGEGAPADAADHMPGLGFSR